MVLAGKTLLFTAAELDGQEHHRAEGLQSLASFPISYQGRVLGCINLASHTLLQVPAYARNALETIAAEIGHVAIFLHTAEALRHSEERYRRLAENSPSLIYRYEFSPQRGFSFVNGAATRMTGYSPEEHYADPDLGFKLVHPDDRPLLAAATNSGDAYSKPLVLRWLRKDGTMLWTEQRNLPIYDAGGNIIAIEGIANDISESRHAQIALQQSEEKYRGLLASLDSIVATVDSDGRFLYMNDPAASQLGGETAELTGKTMYELFPEPVAASQMRQIHKAIDEDRAQVYETISMVQGEPRWHRTTIQPIHDETGRAIYALVNATDIHDLKTTQQELLELNYTLEERIKQRTAEVQDLYDNAPAGYHSLDANGHVIMINQTELNWLGYTREEVIGRPITDFHSAASRQAFRAVYPTFMERGWVKDSEYEYALSLIHI